MDTLLAIASRRDERRTLTEPLPPALARRLLDAGRLSGSARTAASPAASPIDGCADTTTGAPEAIASVIGMPKPSNLDG